MTRFVTLAICTSLGVLACSSSSSSPITSAPTTGAGGTGGSAPAASKGGTGGSAPTTGAGGAGGSALTSDAGAPVGAQEACVGFAKAVCQKRDSCSDSKGTSLNYGSPTICEARVAPKCVSNLTAAGTSKTVQAQLDCNTATASTSCSDYFDNVLAPACVPKPGTIVDGSKCISSWQCKSTYCALPHGGVCGVCAPRPKSGDDCTLNVCGTSLLCHSSTKTCVVPVALNASCDQSSPCSSGLSCVGDINNPDGSATPTKGVCKTMGTTVGTACDPVRSTLPGCNENLNLFCDPTSKTCKTIQYVGDGQPCGMLATGKTLCTGGGLCVGVTTTVLTGTCKAPAQEGKPCNVTTGPPCLDPAKCVSGVCTLPDPTTCK